MIVVDSSALIAIFEGEAEKAPFLRLIGNTGDVRVSAVQVHETAIVMHRRRAGGA
jgi:uncharacterized protein with PIN domain